MNQEVIYVLLPIYARDSVDYLTLAIDSILCQTYSYLRLWIGVDGRVPIEFDEVLERYASRPSVKIVRFDENRGLACVLNDLLSLCMSEGAEYIARMDADDISLPDRLEKQLTYLQNHPEVDVVGGAIEEIDELGKSRNKVIVYPQNPETCRAFFSKRNPLAHPAVMFRKRFFEKVGHLYRPEYRQNQDTMLWYDGLMADVQMANIPDVVLRFRMTNAMFKKRRNGYRFAKKQLDDRRQINKDLQYGCVANLFAYAMFLLMISPAWFRKFAYRIFR